MSHKRSYQSTGSYLWVSVYCVPGIIQKVIAIYRFLLIFFSVLSARSHTKSSTNLQVLIYGMFLLGIHQEDLECSSTTTANHYLESAEVCRVSYFIGSYIWVLVYCVPGVTKNVLPIYRFSYIFLLVCCLLGITQNFPPIYRFLYTGFFFKEYIKKIWDVPQPQQPITIWRVQKYARHLNLLALMYGFSCIVYQVSHKRFFESTGS